MGDNGCTGTVSTIFPGRQQTGFPEEDPGQQPGRQASVQFVPEGAEEAAAGPVWTPLLLLLLQQDSEVSAAASSQLAGVCVCECV